MTAVVVGVDFGATKIRAGAVDEGGRIIGAAEVATEASRGVEAVIENLDRAVRGAAEAAHVPLARLGGVGVAAPGQIDRSTQAVIDGPNLGWHDVPLGSALRARWHLKIAIENDVNAAALGEFRFGAGRDRPEARDLALISVGTGIGGGIVANGRLVSGASGAAGEVGHLVFRPGGEPCSCGGRGHFEAYAGGACIERRLGRPLAEVLDAADRGEATAAAAVRDLEEALGTLAANVVSLLNPALLVISGGVVRRRRALVAVAAEAVSRLAVRAAARACRVVESALFENAAVLGSAELVRLEGRAAS